MSVTMLVMIAMARSIIASSVPHTFTEPSSEMSILNAGFLDDLVDYLALLSYHITDLLRINGDLLDLWSIWA